MSNAYEPTSVGLSERAAERLRHLKDNGFFREMMDGYRFAIALAIGQGVIPDEIVPPKTTIFNIGSLDPDGELQAMIKALFETGDEPVYRCAERLAEWGVNELGRRADSGQIDFAKLLSGSRE
ncbi:hypothetical protein [Caballeronia sp. GAWG1-1]|uniref:hypothetical protein n=1 Tax=Caballeronia sp. GAWG1-1 TaxID=2921742 RepID=UPI002027D017|nr:hypothetical protein [Caballeronia sp. GAWG1-1]